MSAILVPLWLGRTEYARCWSLQERLHALRQADELPDVLLLTEHEHTYTAGRRRGADHLLLGPDELRRRGIAYHQSDRGGDITYHGPGQLVGYPILRLAPKHGGAVGYLRRLELALLELLAGVGVAAHVREGYTGAWTARGKIASIGVRISAGVTMHGFALNVDPELEYFDGIVPCGISGCVMSSAALELGRRVQLAELLAPAATAVARALGLEPGGEAPEALRRLAGLELQGRASCSTLGGPVLD
jgi:lipoyl(octanoyl) transferase